MGWLQYENQRATRSQQLDPRLVNALGFVGDMGLQMHVFSGGQPSSGPNRVGSHRHDLGGAGDVYFTRDGRKLDWANASDRPIFQDIVSRARAAGVTGFGAGPGYMRPGSMHIGFGSPAVWGAGGSGANAPGWLREAAGGMVGNVPATPTMQQQTAPAAMPAAPSSPAEWTSLFGDRAESSGLMDIAQMQDRPPMTPERFMMNMISGQNPLKSMVLGKLFSLFA